MFICLTNTDGKRILISAETILGCEELESNNTKIYLSWEATKTDSEGKNFKTNEVVVVENIDYIKKNLSKV